MSKAFTTAAAQLAAVLQAENAALEAVDLQAAAAMLPAKQTAAAAFAVAGQGAPPPEAAPLLAELRHLAQRNEDLLAQGIIVQGRLIGIVAQAAAESMRKNATGYGAGGAPRDRRMPALALASRA